MVEKSPRPSPLFVGTLERSVIFYFRGWAICTAELGQSLTVELFLDDAPFIDVVSSIPRKVKWRDRDLFGPYGFSIDVLQHKERLLDGRIHRIAARVKGTDFSLRNSPFTLDPITIALDHIRLARREIEDAEHPVDGP